MVGSWRIWAEVGATQQIYPLLHTAFWIDIESGATPRSVITSSTCSGTDLGVFAGRGASAVGGARRRLAGMIFALHPRALESVAAILGAETGPRPCSTSQPRSLGSDSRVSGDRRVTRWRRSGFGLHCSRTTLTATLPAALLVVTWWRSGRLSWRDDVQPLLPWLVLGAAAGIGTAWLRIHPNRRQWRRLRFRPLGARVARRPRRLVLPREPALAGRADLLLSPMERDAADARCSGPTPAATLGSLAGTSSVAPT